MSDSLEKISTGTETRFKIYSTIFTRLRYCLHSYSCSRIVPRLRTMWSQAVPITRCVQPRDPRTTWSAHRSVRVGAIFFGFYWSRCGPKVLKFFWSWCGADQPALVRGSLVQPFSENLFNQNENSYITNPYFTCF